MTTGIICECHNMIYFYISISDRLVRMTALSSKPTYIGPMFRLAGDS